MNIMELGLNDLDNWEIASSDESSATLKPTIDLLIQRNAIMIVELLPVDMKVDVYDFVEEYGERVVGNISRVVPIEDDTGPNNESLTYGFVSKGQDKDRYYIIKIENSPRSLICSRIELDVTNEKADGSFLDGNMSINLEGVQVKTDEMIPYAITLRGVADTFSPLIPTESRVDVCLDKFRSLEVGLSELELLGAVGHPTEFRGTDNQFKVYILTTGEEVHIKFKSSTTGWCIVNFPNDTQEELFGEC